MKCEAKCAKCGREGEEGEYNLRLRFMKELHPELIATHQGEAKCGRSWIGRRTRGGRGDSSRPLLFNQLVLACITFCIPQRQAPASLEAHLSQSAGDVCMCEGRACIVEAIVRLNDPLAFPRLLQ